MNQRLKILIDEYANSINTFGNNSTTNAWFGSFLHNKDRFHSPFFHTFFIFKSQGIIKSPYLNFYQFFKELIIKFLRWNYHFINSLITFFIVKIIYIKKILPIRNQTYCVIKSFCYKGSVKDGMFKDSFFSDFSNQLKSRGKNSITFIDGLGVNYHLYNDLKSIPSVFPYQIFNRFSDYPLIYLEVILSLFKIPTGNPIIDGISFKKIMKRQFICDIFNPILFNGLLLAKSIKRFSKIYKIESLYMTYENINWERPFIRSIKESSPETTIIGFQHAAISFACTNYFLSSEEELNSPIPDYIIASGEATAKIIKNYSNISITPIIDGFSLRQSTPQKHKMLDRSYEKTLLVALEGSPESLECIEFIVSKAKELQNWNIILRPHPIFPLSKCLKGSDIDLNVYSNIKESSSNEVIDDLKNCSIVLYRGSTVAFEAIRNGRPVIHFKQSELIDYDPLYELQEFKQIVTKDSTIAATLESIINLKDEDYQFRLKNAQSYIEKYFERPTKDKLDYVIGLNKA